jgi:hypothetical protein
MANANPQDNAYAALLVASSAAASKRAYRRGPPPTGLPAHLQLPSLPDLPSLFADAPDDATPRAQADKLQVARVTTASLLYALKTDGYCERILRPAERVELETLTRTLEDEHVSRDGRAKIGGVGGADRSCLYCRLFHKALYRDHRVPRALVVNHRAHVTTDFDPDTNISEAGITGYQVLVPEDAAVAMVAAYHPLRWQANAGEIFQQTDEVFAPSPGKLWQIPEPVTGSVRDEVIARWKREPEHYLYEDVQMPWNGQAKSEIRNVLKIRAFRDESADGYRALAFRFALESCLESNFGIRLERGGLDIDGGRHSGEAERWPEKGLPKTLGKLSVRDLAHLRHLANIDPRLSVTEQSDDSPTESEKLDTLTSVVGKLRREWRQQPWLVSISTSKRLRYTAPVDMPLALWTALTWMAPAQLFVFINRVVTEAHVQGYGFASGAQCPSAPADSETSSGELIAARESDTRELRPAPSSIPVHSGVRPSLAVEPGKRTFEKRR